MKDNRCRSKTRLVYLVVIALLLAAPRPSGAQAGGANPHEPPIDPATGEPPGAPTGCCCFPKADSPAGAGQICKNMTEFDCKAECAELREGRLPSGCRWTTGACPKP
jgi:hypothetical protein